MVLTAVDLDAAEAAAFGEPPESASPKPAASGTKGTACLACRRAKRKCTHGAEPALGAPSGSGTATAPAPAHPPRTRGGDAAALRDAENNVMYALQGLFGIAANVWDDPELAVPDEEARPCAAAWARTLDQLGLLHHTRKLAPAEALGRTAQIALPRAKRLALKQAQKPKPGTRPQFRRPPGMQEASPPPEAAAATPPRPPQSIPHGDIGVGFDAPYRPNPTL